MPNYYWKGLNAKGVLVEGVMQASNRGALFESLCSREIVVLRAFRYFLKNKNKNDNKKMVLFFTRRIVFLLQAHIQIGNALLILEQSEKRENWKKVIKQLRNHIQAGKSLSEAMCEWGSYFSESYRAFVVVGEETGNFTSIFEHLLELLESRKRFQLQIKKAISYPIFLLICTLLIGSGILLFIIPSYSDFFKSMGGELPALTRRLLAFSIFLKNNAVLLCIMSVAIVSIFLYAIRNAKIRFILDRYFLHIPFIGRLAVNAHITEWSYLLSLALDANVPILKALMMANAVIQNTYLKNKWSQLPTDLVLGRSLYEGLQQIQWMDLATLQLVLIGENSGTLASILNKIAADHAMLLTEDLSRLARCIEPAAIIILAGLTGIVVAALYLPMIHLGLNI